MASGENSSRPSTRSRVRCRRVFYGELRGNSGRYLRPLLRRCDHSKGDSGGPTFCRSADRVPPGANSAEVTRRAEWGAEAPGQRTARGRLQRPSWAALPVAPVHCAPTLDL